MEVMPGYERTVVGLIPEDWDVELLGDLSEFVTSGSRGWAQFYSESGRFSFAAKMCEVDDSALKTFNLFARHLEQRGIEPK